MSRLGGCSVARATSGSHASWTVATRNSVVLVSDVRVSLNGFALEEIITITPRGPTVRSALMCLDSFNEHDTFACRELKRQDLFFLCG